MGLLNPPYSHPFLPFDPELMKTRSQYPIPPKLHLVEEDVVTALLALKACPDGAEAGLRRLKKFQEALRKPALKLSDFEN